MPTPRPEPDLIRRTVRVIVSAAAAGVRFALRLGEDGWVQVREHREGDGPQGGQLWPVLLRGLAEAEEVVVMRAARLAGRDEDNPGGTGTTVRVDDEP